MADLYENILNSINLVANSKAESLDYDRTSICIILEVTDKGNGKYLVTDSSTKFYAYSYNDKYYAVNDVVYVTIPNNDYNKQKWILGLASSDENEVYKVVDPEGAFSEITFRKIIEEEFGLLANGEEEVITLFETKEQIDSKDKWYLCLAGDFNTSIQNAVDGVYGIRLILNTNKEEPEWITYELGPENMTGPIYQQDVTQAVYYIMNEFALDGYKIEFYQNKKFLYENGNLVTYEGLNNENFVNIKVSNIKIYIGEVADIEEQFKDIHYSQIQNNNGFIVGKNQTVTGMFTYDNKKETSILSSNGTTTFGFKPNGQIKADEYGTSISGPIDFDIKNGDLKYLYTQDDIEHIDNVVFEKECIENSKDNLERNLFKEYFDIRFGDIAAASKKTLTYYIDFENGSDENNGSGAFPFLSFEPIKKYLIAQPAELKVIFLGIGEVDLSDLDSLNDLTLNFGGSGFGQVDIFCSSNCNFNNCNITISGNNNFAFHVYAEESINIKNCKINLQFINFLSNIYMKSSNVNIKNSYLLQGLKIDFSNVHLNSSYIDELNIVSSNIYFNSCLFYNSNTEIYNTVYDSHCYAESSNLSFGGNSKLFVDGEDRQKTYWWTALGGEFSFLNGPSVTKSLSRDYIIEGEASTGEDGSVVLQKFKDYIAQLGGKVGGGQCGEGASEYARWMGFQTIDGRWAWEMYTKKSWASWASEIQVSERQPGDIAFWNDGGYGHVAMVDNDVNCYYGQNQGDGAGEYGKPFNSMYLGAPHAVIRPNHFGNASTLTMLYIENPRKYKKFMNCLGTILTSSYEIMKKWCILVNATATECYKIDYNDYLVNENLLKENLIEEVTKETALKALMEFTKCSEELAIACTKLCAYEGYGENIEFASYMAATVINRMKPNPNYTPSELYRAWGGTDMQYNSANIDGKQVSDWVYEAIALALNGYREEGEVYSKAWDCHGLCAENGFVSGIQRSQDVLVKKDGKPVFAYFSTEMWAGVWPQEAKWY